MRKSVAALVTVVMLTLSACGPTQQSGVSSSAPTREVVVTAQEIESTRAQWRGLSCMDKKSQVQNVIVPAWEILVAGRIEDRDQGDKVERAIRLAYSIGTRESENEEIIPYMRGQITRVHMIAGHAPDGDDGSFISGLAQYMGEVVVRARSKRCE